jgi:hypothetical protein
VQLLDTKRRNKGAEKTAAPTQWLCLPDRQVLMVAGRLHAGVHTASSRLEKQITVSDRYRSSQGSGQDVLGLENKAQQEDETLLGYRNV